MQTVVFTFKSDVVSERQKEILSEIQTWKEVQMSQSLDPNSANPEIQRMCYVYVGDGVDLKDLSKKISQFSEIQDIASPKERGLI